MKSQPETNSGKPALLCWEDIWHHYLADQWIVAGVTMEIAAGELLGIIGPNGAGKSTLLRIAAGVLSPSRGRITFNGRDVRTFSRRGFARLAGYLPQAVVSEYDYRSEEIVAMGRYPHSAGFGFLSDTDQRVIEHCLELTGAVTFRHRRLSQLSGGERQRVFLASVLAQEPALLLLDEPTAALDVQHQIHFFDLLLQLIGQGIGVAVVTHDLNLAACYCSRLALMHQGRVAALGPPASVLRAERLIPIYGPRLRIIAHPDSGLPAILPEPPSVRPVGDGS